MVTIQVFDPSLCCSTGVCGVEVDQQLVTFAADVDWLAKQGVKIERFNLAQQPQAFVDHSAIRQLLVARGESALPAILVDGNLRQSGRYPTRDQLAQWAVLELAHRVLDKEAVRPASAALSSIGVKASGGCCAPAPDATKVPASKCC